VASDALQVMDWDARIGEPCQGGVPKIVASQVFVAELGNDFVPRGGVAEDRRCNSAASGTGEQPGVLGAIGCVDAALHEVPNLIDQRDLSCALPLGALVD
jgi:hypothetical protein